VHYRESSSTEWYQLLQKNWFLAKNIANKTGGKYKDNFDKEAFPHNFEIVDLVWYKDFSPIAKNLTPT
jgi:hypothetical protein